MQAFLVPSLECAENQTCIPIHEPISCPCSCERASAMDASCALLWILPNYSTVLFVCLMEAGHPTLVPQFQLISCLTLINSLTQRGSTSFLFPFFATTQLSLKRWQPFFHHGSGTYLGNVIDVPCMRSLHVCMSQVYVGPRFRVGGRHLSHCNCVATLAIWTAPFICEQLHSFLWHTGWNMSSSPV